MPGILWLIGIGLVAGWVAGLIMRGRGFGVVGDIVVGILGAFIGSLVFDWMNVGAGGLIGSIVVAVIGAVIFLFLASLFQRGSTRLGF